MNIHELLKASSVQQFHTVETITIRTVAHHTFNMTLIADWAYNGKAPAELIRAILHHDLHKLYLGDIPYPIKCDTIIAEALDSMEYKINEKMGILHELPNDLKRILILIGMLESLQFLVNERELGNTGLTEVFIRTCDVISPIFNRQDLIFLKLEGFYLELTNRFNSPLTDSRR